MTSFHNKNARAKTDLSSREVIYGYGSELVSKCDGVKVCPSFN